MKPPREQGAKASTDVIYWQEALRASCCYALPETDWSLLDPVRARGSICRM